jgi:iron complex outermembrane recepter protein
MIGHTDKQSASPGSDRSDTAAFVLTSVCIAVMCCSGVANTQEIPSPARPATSPTGTLEEIVVSAEKRESTVQKTPISIAAITGAELEARGQSTLLSVAQSTPGMSFKSSGPGQTEFEMRGLTSSGGFSPTVGFYLNDAPVAGPAQSLVGKVAIDPDLYDLNRIEVLRGPQGTLYGSGSMGGTIKLITNPPVLNKFSANAEATGSSTDGGGFNYGANVMLNLPMVEDRVALRLVGTDKWIDGWIDRVVLSPFPLESLNSNGTFAARGNVLDAPVQHDVHRSNWERLVGGRATLLFQVNDRLSITPGVTYQRITMGGPNTIDNPPGSQEAHYQPFDVAEPFKDSFALYTATIKYDFNRAQLTSATSKWNREERQDQDISEAMQILFGFPAYTTAAGGVGQGSITATDTTSQWTEELRLASTGTDPFQWLVGLFYSDFKSDSQFHSIYDGFGPLFGTNILSVIDQPITITQKAAFGEASYKLTPKLKLTAGLRWYDYRSTEITTSSGLATIASGPGVVTLDSGAASATGFNPKVNLAYSVSDDFLLYATAVKGFRPGAVNQPIPLTGPLQCLTGPGNAIDLGFPTIPRRFGADNVWSYEIGEKLRALDDRIVINGDVYYERWNSVQQQIAPACGFIFTANAGTAAIYGSEIEVTAKLGPQWMVAQSVGYTHATVIDSVLVSLRDQRLLDVPDVTASTSIAYAAPVSARYNFAARVMFNYVGPMQDITFARNNLPGYGLASARFGIESDVWSAFVFADNLADRHVALTNTTALSANVSILNRVATNQPRTLGVTLRYRF